MIKALKVQPTKIQASEIVDKLLIENYELTEKDKAILVSFFKTYNKTEKDEAKRLKSFTKHLKKDRAITYALHYFTVISGKAYISDGHFLVKTPTTLKDGVYDKRLNVVAGNYNFPDYTAMIKTIEKSLSVPMVYDSSIQKTGTCTTKTICFHDAEDNILAKIPEKLSTLLNMHGKISINGPSTPIVQYQYDTTIVIMPFV